MISTFSVQLEEGLYPWVERLDALMTLFLFF